MNFFEKLGFFWKILTTPWRFLSARRRGSNNRRRSAVACSTAVDRVVEAGTNIMIAMYAKLTYTSLLTLDKLRHKLFLSSLHQKKVDHRRLPPNFLGCEVSLPPGVSSNTGVAVHSSRSVWVWCVYWILAVNTNLNTKIHWQGCGTSNLTEIG